MLGLRSWLYFWWQCLRYAFFRWERGGALMSLSLPPILTLICWSSLIGIGAGWYSETIESLRFVPIILIAVITFLIAPYKLWSEQKGRAEKAELKLKPCISIEPIVLQSPWHDHVAYIRVKNQGEESIHNCFGYLESVETDMKKTPPMLPVYLKWSTRHGGQDNKETLTFSTEADLAIAHLKPYSNQLCIQLNTFNPDLEYQYEFDYSLCILDIKIGAENCVAIMKKYKLFVAPEELQIWEKTKWQQDPKIPKLKLELL